MANSGNENKNIIRRNDSEDAPFSTPTRSTVLGDTQSSDNLDSGVISVADRAEAANVGASAPAGSAAANGSASSEPAKSSQKASDVPPSTQNHDAGLPAVASLAPATVPEAKQGNLGM